MANFLRHDACPDCGGSDCLAVYDDDSTYCFGRCQCAKGITKGRSKVAKKKDVKFVEGIEYGRLNARKISEAICKKYDYGTGLYTFNDLEQYTQIATYRDDTGAIIAQKIRSSEKDFKFLGGSSEMLYGRHLWRNKGGKKIIITEGEVDCLSVAEAFDGKYPVVSLGAGAQSARKCLQANIDFLESFEQIVLWFDSDEAGQKAIEDSKGIFSPSKLYVVPFDNEYKDANEVLKALGKQGVVNKTYEAREVREDNIVRGSEITFEETRKNIKAGRPFPYPKLQSKTMGVRDGELIIWTAGSGIGKSTIVTEIGKYTLDTDASAKLGVMYLEESRQKTVDRFIALDHKVPLKLLRLNHDLIPEEEAYKTYEKYFKSDRINMYDHFGSVNTNRLLEKIKYLFHACGCTTIILDHISIAVSGLQTDENERKMIDIFMTEMRSFVEATGCTIHAIVHLKRATDKKSFNEGGQISLTDLRGSASLEQLSDGVIAVERNQQGDDPYKALIRVLKWRETGDTGACDYIRYNPSIGCYELVEDDGDPEYIDEGDKKF